MANFSFSRAVFENLELMNLLSPNSPWKSMKKLEFDSENETKVE